MIREQRRIDRSLIESAEAPVNGPIFIGGTGRCGTTVLVRTLGLHPRIHALVWETQFIVAPNGLLNLAINGYPRKELRLFLAELKGRWYNRTISRSVKGPGFSNEQVRSYSAGLSADVTQEQLEEAIQLLRSRAQECNTEEEHFSTARAFIDCLFSATLNSAGATRWSEKTPRNVLFVDRLIQLYPSCRFIHIVRDGRDVVSSMLQKGFWPIAPGHEFPGLREFRGRVTFEAATRFWVAALEMTEQLTANIPRQNYHKLRLEDLASDPEETLRRVMAFLGEDFDDRLLTQNFSRANSGRWERDLTATQLRRFNEIAGTTMEREGYTEGS